MTINPSSGEFITLAQAQAYVNDYRKEYPTAIKGYFAGSDKLQEILTQPDCIGLRIYNGYNAETGKTNLVIVGVNSKELDMTDGLILEKVRPCPDNCDVTSALYS